MVAPNLTMYSIGQLFGKTFIIPSYQRGYRWEEKQVDALLNDLKTYINDFKHNDKGCKKGAFYSLQPIVVMPVQEDMYEVIDGQQRLTTIFLILYYLNKFIYGAHAYESEEETKDFDSENLKIKFSVRGDEEQYLASGDFAKKDSNNKNISINEFYIRNAYGTIEKWFYNETKSRRSNYLKTDIHSMLSTIDPKDPAVKVIWYEIPIGSSRGIAEATRTFRRLNYGKIPLTSTEIIKSILLQSDCYGDDKRERMAGEAQRRAMEWDQIERNISQPHFAGMLGVKAENPGMNPILNFVADRIKKDNDYEYTRILSPDKEPDYFNYYVINKYIEEKAVDPSSHAQVVKDIWENIQAVANQLANWYSNRELYHLLGLYSLLRGRSGSNLISEIYGISEEVPDKEALTNVIRQRIGNEIRVPTAFGSNREPLPESRQGLSSPFLNYSEGRKEIIKVLTAFNVWIVQEDNDCERRFPFHQFRKLGTLSLEHIHPRSIANSMDSSSVQYREWLDSVEKSFLPLLEGEKSEKAAKFVKRIRHLLEDGEAFKNSKKKIDVLVKKLEGLLNSEARITPQDIDSIRNLALLDASTNSALGNCDMDEKRRILITKAKGKENIYIPPATEDVFSKKYSSGNIDSMKLWQSEDRERYFSEISRIYNLFCGDSKNVN